MAKNFDEYYGCYNLCTVWDDNYGYTSKDGIYLKVENNKIVDCVEPLKGHNSIKYNLEENLQKVVGENVKDLVLNSVITSKIVGKDVSRIGYITFREIEEAEYADSKRKVFKTETEMKAHDQQVADILQAKDNKNTLGKTSVMDKIADMKSRGGK